MPPPHVLPTKPCMPDLTMTTTTMPSPPDIDPKEPILATYNASCLRKNSRRGSGGVNVGQLNLTPTTLHFHAQYIVTTPTDATLSLPLANLTLLRRMSYRRILPHAILLRVRHHPDYLFSFSTRRHQLTALHMLELAMHDLQDAPSDADVADDSRRLSSADSRLSDACLPHNPRTPRYVSEVAEPTSLPAHSSYFPSPHQHQHQHQHQHHHQLHHRLHTSLTHSLSHAMAHPLAPSEDNDTEPTPQPNALSRSKSHPGDSTSSLAMAAIDDTHNSNSLSTASGTNSNSHSNSRANSSPPSPPSKRSFFPCVGPSHLPTLLKHSHALNLPTMPAIPVLKLRPPGHPKQLDIALFLASVTLLLFVLLAFCVSLYLLRVRLHLVDSLLIALQ